MDWDNRRILFTGATGFIGTRLTQKLIGAGAKVWAGVLPGDASERIAGLPADVRRVSLDVLAGDGVAEAVDQADPDVALPLAAAGAAERGVDAALVLAINGGGAVRLLQALLGRAVRRVILLGTCYEYGALEAREGLDPFNAYAASKVAAWAFGRAFWRGVRVAGG